MQAAAWQKRLLSYAFCLFVYFLVVVVFFWHERRHALKLIVDDVGAGAGAGEEMKLTA